MLNNRSQRAFLSFKPTKALPSHRYVDTPDPFEDFPSEPFLYKQSSAPTIVRFQENLNLSCSFTGPFSPQTPSPKNMLALNHRTLTKGYARFLEDRDFLSHRDQEKTKVEQSVKKAFANADPKVMSEDIQKLVSSTIVNEPVFKLKMLRRSAEIKNLANKMPSLDDRYKKICKRILGEDFESKELFIKEQEEAVIMMKNDQRQVRKSANFEQCWKKGRRGKLSKPQSQVVNSLESGTGKVIWKRGPRTVSAVSVPFNLTETQVEKVETSALDMTKSHCKEAGKTLDSIDETESTGLAGDDEEGSTEKVKCQLSFAGVGDSGLSMGTTKKSSWRSQMSQVKKSGNILEISEISIENGSKVLRKSRGKENKKLIGNKEIEKIDELCKGALKITNKEGIKIKKRQLQVVKDYSKLDVQVEKLRYENTVENWEKSVREVYKIRQTSPFYNLVAL